MIYGVKQSNRFKKDFKLCLKRGLDYNKFNDVLTLLKSGASLPEKYQDHPLRNTDEYKNCRELHIEPNWLLVYKYINNNVILFLVRTGSHPDLFG